MAIAMAKRKHRWLRRTAWIVWILLQVAVFVLSSAGEFDWLVLVLAGLLAGLVVGLVVMGAVKTIRWATTVDWTFRTNIEETAKELYNASRHD